MGLCIDDFSDKIAIEVRSESIRLYDNTPEDKAPRHFLDPIHFSIPQPNVSRTRATIADILRKSAANHYLMDREEEAAKWKEFAKIMEGLTWEEPEIESVEISKDALLELIAYFAEHPEFLKKG